MINILLNGKEVKLSSKLSISELLQKKNIRPEVVTVELNERILTREEFSKIIIKDGDNIELVYFMGGGTLEDIVLAAKIYILAKSYS